MSISKTTIKAKTTLKSFDDVDAQLLELNKLQSKLDKCQATYQTKIEDLKKKMKKETGEVMDEMNRIAQDIHFFAQGHQDQLDGRSKKLCHGTIAFRLSTSLSLPKNTEPVIKALKRLKRFDLIEITEIVKRAELKKDEALVARVGGILVTKDNFRIELPDHTYDYDKKLKEIKE